MYIYIYTHLLCVYVWGNGEANGHGLENDMETGDPEAPRIVGLRINTSTHYPK